MMSLQFSLIIGIVFGFLGSLMAFLIIFIEYDKHKLGRWRVWKEALAGAILTFVFFFLLAIAAVGAFYRTAR
jgi:H+/Cl- antiporter ClcA